MRTADGEAPAPHPVPYRLLGGRASASPPHPENVDRAVYRGQSGSLK